MNLDHMHRLCGWHFHVLGVAALDNYEFGSDKRGFASIRSRQGKKVYGVLFEIDQKALDTLDEFEGYPEIFGRQEVAVADVYGKSVKAWAYMEPENMFGDGGIREEYMRRMIAGAIENRLPEDWVKFLESRLAGQT